ncbi:hypothetical protein GALMADRAFT_267364 [Galerina marginata CBS 339.88]|uniref:Uncharacterized protein n=1 Tax=Galerina marginata (strain CBS 339.88) TaxID=685588 RepID=A0A067TBB0_GALM3|nr:hypothetical protein GALMADRAFT_267364 [Galerina marginata CBS 339.88]
MWVMGECGTPDVPSFYALRKKQKKLTENIPNLRTRQHTSSVGNQFYMNHPVDLLALDWANPCVRDFIEIYPEITSKISESWQAGKYTSEVKPDQLTPMWANWKRSPSKHFYVNEIAQTYEGKYVIPVRWIIFEKKEHAEVKMPHPVRVIANGRPAFCIRIMPWADDVSGNRSKQYNAHMNMYVANVNLPHRKLAQEYFVRFCSTSPHASSSEQFEALAEDLRSGEWNPAYDCRLNTEIIFQIHAHLLPADNPQQAESCSTAGANANLWCRGDQSGGTAIERESNKGYDALFHRENLRTPEKTIKTIKDQIWVAGLGVQEAVDNIQTETGVKDKTALFWIQQMIDKARIIHQARLFTPATRDPRLNDPKIKGPPRELIKTEIKIEVQRELFQWVITQPADRYARLDENSPLRKSLRPGDHYNILLDIPGLDPHRDSPCEILHTVLLGDDKYLWHDTNKVWDKKQDKLFAIRLQSSSIDGLSLSPIRAQFLVQYKNSLIGKHFKGLQQLGVFHLHDNLCTPDYFDLWKANGELGAMLWYPEIENIETYLSDLQILLDNVLDLWAVVDPMRITTKLKLHVLGAHTAEDIRRFGPAILFSTEVFECWNAVFRLCSVLSNHQAPSHDIAVTLADMERFKHQVSGGWWKNSNGDYVQAGANVRDFMKSNKQLQRRLGWADTTNLVAGFVQGLSKKKQNPRSWTSAVNALQTTEVSPDPSVEIWVETKHLISQSHDVCKPGSWIFFEEPASSASDASNSQPSVLAGRIFQILAPINDASTQKTRAFVIIEHFDIAGTTDSRMNMPVLSPTKRIFVLSPKAVLFIFNAQHDCYGLKCPLVECAIKQGRDMTTRTQLSVSHSSDTRYFLNMHALHNANLIRKTLPRELYAPKPYFNPDLRRTEHDKLAGKARSIGETKRIEQKVKAKATRARNKGKNSKKGPLTVDIVEDDVEDGMDE